MNFYNTKKWKDKRRFILKRDGYVCMNCKRFGRTTEATTVHHVFPYEEYPEYKLNNINLLSLCEKCHNNMHDRKNHKITKLGKEWQRKITPLLKNIK